MTTQAQREAKKRYKAKTIQKQIEYSPNEAEEYKRIDEYCRQMDISYQRYVKDLIRRDMERMEKERGVHNHESTSNE